MTVNDDDIPSISYYELFELAVDVMIKCDDLYFRLYYDQITNTLPRSRSSTSLSSSSSLFYQSQDSKVKEGEAAAAATELGRFIFIPHPLQYFLLVQQHHHEKNNNASKRFSLAEATTTDQRSKSSIFIKNFHGRRISRHPLEVIYNLREQETVELFDHSGWTQHPKTLQQWSLIRQAFRNNDNINNNLASIDRESSRISSSSPSPRTSAQKHDKDETLDQHETPAPSLLRAWRDSNRDFLCHLYCYATVSTESLMAMSKYLKNNHKLRIESIIEIGAGTGYLAEVLSRFHGMDVEAYDDVPTKTTTTTSTEKCIHNEYHGSVPAFRNVKRWSASSSSKVRFPSNYGSESASALLLCYPPPNSSMAADTLKKALSSSIATDGLLVIHIGEFKGLTGNSEFENILQEKYKCIYRRDCLHWGTDASELTVWEFVGSPSLNPRSVLIKCNNCDKESNSRCRYLRTYCLCSRCWSESQSDTPNYHGGDGDDHNVDSESDSDSDSESWSNRLDSQMKNSARRKLRSEAKKYQVGCFQKDDHESELEASDFIDLPVDGKLTRP